MFKLFNSLKIEKGNSIKENALFWLFLLNLIVIPLYPKFPLFSVPGTYVAIRAEDFLIALTCILAVIFNFKRIKELVRKPITQLFILFWIIGAIAYISGLFVTQTVNPLLGLLHLLRRVEYMSLFFIALLAIRSKQHLKLSLVTMFITAIIVVLYGFGQIYLQFPAISTTNREFSKGEILTLTPDARANSTFAGHYDLAMYLSVVVIFFVGYFFNLRKYWEKGLMMLSGFGSLVLLGFTASRASFVAALGAVALYLWLSGKKWFILGLIILSIGIVAAVPQLRHRLVATVTVNLLDGGGPKYTPTEEVLEESQKGGTFSANLRIRENGEVIESTESATESSRLARDIAPGEPVNTTELGVFRSYNIRLDVEWPRAIMAFYKNPLLGTGFSSLNIATDNGYLRSLGEVGLLGTSSLLILIGIIFWIIFKSSKKLSGLEQVFLHCVMCSIVVLGLTTVLFDVLEASKIAILFWALLGIAWSVSQEYKDV